MQYINPLNQSRIGAANDRYGMAQALMGQALAPQQAASPLTALGQMLTAYFAKKGMTGAHSQRDAVLQEQSNQNQTEMARALSAYRGDTPYQPAPFETFDETDQLPEGLAMQGNQRDKGAMIDALMQAQNPQLQQLGMQQMLAPAGEQWSPPFTIGNDGRHYIQNLSTGETKMLGGGGVNVNVGGPTTKGLEEVDKKFGQEYADWVTGGYADTQKSLAQLRDSIDRLKSGTAETGPRQGLTPDFLKSVTDPDLLVAKQQIEEVVQRNLRVILGAQFTEKEGERLIARAFDDKLPTHENVMRVERLLGAVEAAAQAKQQAGEYFRANGTLTGFDGAALLNKDNFTPENLFGDDRADGPRQAMPDLPDPAQHDGRVVRDTETGKRYRSVNGQWMEM